MGQEWDEDPESMINQSAPAAAQATEQDASAGSADDDGSFSPELFDEDEVCILSYSAYDRMPVYRHPVVQQCYVARCIDHKSMR